MQEDEFEEEKGGSESSEKTKIEVELGNLSIEVENHDRQEAEEQFYRLYNFLVEDIEEWSTAMNEVLTQRGGFQ